MEKSAWGVVNLWKKMAKIFMNDPKLMMNNAQNISVIAEFSTNDFR